MTLSLIHNRMASAIAIVIAGSASYSVLAEDSEHVVLEEVVIYAQKREQTVFEVPVSVSSYGSDALDKTRVRDLSDLTQLSPSLAIDNSSGAADTAIYIRGTGTSGNNPGFEQSVGVFIDGVYRGRPGSAMSDYVDIEGIEVLKGPQGTLFGRNTSAGVVSVRTAQPSYESSGTLEASVGNFDYRQVRGSVTGALIEDKLAYRLSGSWHERDGFSENPFTGAELFDRDRYSIRGQLLWDINEDASLRVIMDKSRTDEQCCGATPLLHGPAQALIDAVDGPQFERLPATPYSYQGQASEIRDVFDRDFASNTPYRDKIEDQGISAELNWEFSDTALTVIVSARNFENFQQIDADHNSADLISRIQEYDIDEKSLEIRWASTGVQVVDWTVGAYFFDQQIDYSSPLLVGEDMRAYVDLLSAFPASAGPLAGLSAISLIEAGLGVAPGTYYGGDNYANSANDYSAESYALFGQGTWNITDDLSLTLGLRYSDEEKQADYIPDYNNPYSELTAAQLQTGLVNATGGGLTGADLAQAVAGAQQLQFLVPYDAFSANYEDDNLSATVSVNYQIRDNLSVFARYASGYKSGGLNLDRDAAGVTPGNPTANPQGAVFEPEQVDAFELGLKSNLLDDRLSLSATLFYQELEDYQFQSFVGTSFLVRNAAKTEGKGLELDITFKPNYNWLISGGLVWQDIAYDEFSAGPNTLAQTLAGQPANSNDLSGDRVVQSSDFSASFLVAYNQSISDELEFTTNLSGNYRSDFYTDASNEPLSEQDAKILNATVGIGTQDGRWALELWGKNLTDEEVYSSFPMTVQTGSIGAFTHQAPRTYGLSAKYNF